MGYRRGFKSEANAIAREVRGELGLQMLDALDPWRLAGLLAVPVVPLSALRDIAPRPIGYLMDIEPAAFSAVTVFRGRRRAVVYNDAHSPGRQASDVTHELAHALLLHEPAPALDERGCRLWNQNIEDEAQWLAGALLVTEDAAVWIVRNNLALTEAARRFGVRVDMVRYRLNMTGARQRVARARFRIV